MAETKKSRKRLLPKGIPLTAARKKTKYGNSTEPCTRVTYAHTN